MHGDLLAKGVQRVLVACRFQAHDDAELAQTGLHGVVDITADDPVRDLDGSGTAQVHVLADLGDGVGQFARNRTARTGIRHLAEHVDIATGLGGQSGDVFHERLELLVPRHEIGLGIDLDDRALGAVDRDADQPLGGDAAGLLRGLGEAAGTQPVNGGFHVAIGFCQGLLTVHHADSGHLAERLHHLGCDFHMDHLMLRPMHWPP